MSVVSFCLGSACVNKRELVPINLLTPYLSRIFWLIFPDDSLCQMDCWLWCHQPYPINWTSPSYWSWHKVNMDIQKILNGLNIELGTTFEHKPNSPLAWTVSPSEVILLDIFQASHGCFFVWGLTVTKIIASTFPAQGSFPRTATCINPHRGIVIGLFSAMTLVSLPAL